MRTYRDDSLWWYYDHFINGAKQKGVNRIRVPDKRHDGALHGNDIYHYLPAYCGSPWLTLVRAQWKDIPFKGWTEDEQAAVRNVMRSVLGCIGLEYVDGWKRMNK
jgi:hypothetical protein